MSILLKNSAIVAAILCISMTPTFQANAASIPVDMKGSWSCKKGNISFKVNLADATSSLRYGSYSGKSQSVSAKGNSVVVVYDVSHPSVPTKKQKWTFKANGGKRSVYATGWRNMACN